MKKILLALSFLLLSMVAMPKVSAQGVTFTNPVRFGTALPAACQPGSPNPLFFLTNAGRTTGALYECSAPNTWTLVAGTGGMGCSPSGGAGVVQASDGAGNCENTSITDNGTTVTTTEPIVAPSVSTGGSPPTIAWFTGTSGIYGFGSGTCTGTVPAGAAFFVVCGGVPEILFSGGDVTVMRGPLSSTAGHIMTFADTTGGLAQDGGALPAAITALTGDGTATGPGSAALTLATVNSDPGSCGSATVSCIPTTNGKGFVISQTTATITPAIGSVTGLGTGVGSALATNIGSAGAPVVLGGALGTPSGGTATNISGLPLGTGVTGVLARANGGLNSNSAGTGILRDGTTPAASELSGDATTSGSNTVTVVKINGVTVTGTPSSGQVPTAINSTSASWQTPSGGAGAGSSVTSVTPVTANANSTADQQMMELTLGAGYFNSSKQPFQFFGAGVYTTQTLQTPTATFKAKLCTVSGCGSGTVVTLASIVTTATLAGNTNNNWSLSFLGITATTGATGNLEVHGPLTIDLGATTATADSIFSDTNTAVSSNIDLTAALFVDFTVTFSTQPTTPFNAATQRSGAVMPFAAAAAPVTSVFTQTGAVGNLTGDVTTSGTVATTIAASAVTTTKINNNAVTSAKEAVVNTRRMCDIAVGDTSASAITNAQLGPQKRICYVPAASTIVEMDVAADGGTPNVIVAVNHAGSDSNIVSGALATAASGGIACTNTGGTTGIDGATTCTNTLQNTSVAAGDYLELVSGTAGGTAKLMTIHVIYTIN